jgi:hypothetical protein
MGMKLVTNNISHLNPSVCDQGCDDVLPPTANENQEAQMAGTKLTERSTTLIEIETVDGDRYSIEAEPGNIAAMIQEFRNRKAVTVPPASRTTKNPTGDGMFTPTDNAEELPPNRPLIDEQGMTDEERDSENQKRTQLGDDAPLDPNPEPLVAPQSDD